MEDDWQPVVQNVDAQKSSDDDWTPVVQRPSIVSDVTKTLVGNVAPTAATNVVANAISAPYTVGSYALQAGLKGGQYLAEAPQYLYQKATGTPEKSQSDYDNEQKDFANYLLKKVGLPETSNGDISQLVPTPAALANDATKQFNDTGLYRPQTEQGQGVANIGNMVTAGGAFGIPKALIGAGTSELAQEAVKNSGGGEGLQFGAGLIGGLGGAKAADIMPTPVGKVMSPPGSAPTPELDPVDILRSHAASQAAASNVNNIIGNHLETMAGDATAYAPSAKTAVENMLEQAQNGTEPIKNRSQVIKALTHTLSQFDENGNMPVKAALDLKVLANQNYKSGQNMYTGAWGDVRDAAQDVLSDHAIDNPEFGQMLHLQRLHNANDVGEAYKNNDTLQKMFGVDDLKNVQDADNGILRSVGTDTQKAANSVVDKIKTPEDYQAVVRGIDDPQVRQQFNDKLLQRMLPSRAQYAWNTMKNLGNLKWGDAVENFGKTFIPKLGLNDNQLGIYKAIKDNSVNPTRYSVADTEGKANSIMSDWQNRTATKPNPVYESSGMPREGAGESPINADVNFNNFESKAQAASQAAQAAQEASAKSGAKQWRTDAYNAGANLLPSPAINVPPGGFNAEQPMSSLDIGAQLQRPQAALPPPREMSYDDMVKSGRILTHQPVPNYQVTPEGNVMPYGQDNPIPYQVGERGQQANFEPLPPPASTFTAVAPNALKANAMLSKAKDLAGKSGIDPSRITVTKGQLTIKNPTHEESAHLQELINNEQQKFLNRSTGGIAAMQTRASSARSKDPTQFKNILHYFADHGGIQNESGTEKISNLGLGNNVPVGFINKNGMTHEAALNKAIEDRWLPDRGDDNQLSDLYDHIQDNGSSPHPEANRAQISRRDDLEAEADKRGIEHENISDEHLEHMLNEHANHEHHHEEYNHAAEAIPLEAYEKDINKLVPSDD